MKEITTPRGPAAGRSRLFPIAMVNDKASVPRIKLHLFDESQLLLMEHRHAPYFDLF